MSFRKILFATLVLAGTCFADSPVKLKHVSLDEFMSGYLAVSIPLQLSVPEQYDLVTVKEAPESYYYWMIKSEADGVVATGDLPGETGYMYAKISLDVGYRTEKDVFVGAEDLSAKDKAEMESNFSDIRMERCKAGKFPALLMSMTYKKSGYRFYAMYVATLIDTNVVYIAFIPPHKQQEMGERVWGDMRQGLVCGVK